MGPGPWLAVIVGILLMIAVALSYLADVAEDYGDDDDEGVI